MIAATILPLAGADGDPKRAIALASMLAIIVGAIMVAGAVAKRDKVERYGLTRTIDPRHFFPTIESAV
jgi:hypothetical protein